jgi:hypothetical protein
MKIAENSPHLAELRFHLAKLGAGSLPRTAGAMEDSVKFIQDTWRNYAQGGSLPGVLPLKNGSRRYAQSIKTHANGPFSHEIYSEADIADWIENGTKELDMKTTHPYGPQSRISQRTGYPYLIVPFQWGTKAGTARVGPKNIIPKQLLRMMRSKQFKASTVKNETYQSPNARGEMVNRNTYTWGNRAKGSDFSGTIEQKRFADGMVRFEEGSAADRPGKKRYGGYFTFRIISAAPGAKGWIKPATPARHVTKAVMDETREVIDTIVESAIREDLGL